MIGRTIGHYEVVEKLGEGAMGEVWKATDTRLRRSVALKILSSGVAGDPERVKRLEREAEVLASLNHPHVAQIYGVEDAGDGSLALVLEFVAGPTLEDRLADGPIPREQALRIAHQVASALESVHERGLIHRDLKPANVKLTDDGDAKVLDFGLAKGVRLDELKASLTADGVVVGTPAYMSPEQVAGKDPDRRTDVWSFGCLLFEMLAGRPVFRGDSIGTLFAAISTQDADLSELAAEPAAVRRLVERCLRRDPRARLRDIGDARVELEDVLANRATAEPAPPAARPSRRRLAALVGLVLGAVAGGALVAGLLVRPPAEPARYSIALPPPPRELHLDAPSGLAPPIAISPDGRTVVFAAEAPDGRRFLYLRGPSDEKAKVLEGTEDGVAPFFSPDGDQVGFVIYGGQDLHRVDLRKGDVRTVQATDVVNGAAWGPGGTIVVGSYSGGLQRLSLDGGAPTQVTTLGSDEFSHRWPQFLPGGKSVLFTASLRDGRQEPRIVDLEDGELTKIPVQGVVARFVPPGFLVYANSTALLAVRFDLASRLVLGDEVRVVSGMHESVLGTPHFAVSENGVLVYEPVRPPSPGRGLMWVDREGTVAPWVSGEGFEFPRLSSDGRKVAVAIHGRSGEHEIRAIDTERGTETILAQGGNYIEPVWSPGDGEIAFSSFVTENLGRVRVGSAEVTRILDRADLQIPLEWRRDALLFFEKSPQNDLDLLEVDLRDGSVRTLLATTHSEGAATVSPDGRWMAYVSDELGRNDVYLMSYPEAGVKERVSRSGGTEPVWNPLGGELFFRSGRDFYAVPITGDATPEIGAETKLFSGRYMPGFSAKPNYDVTADGRRFVVVEGGSGLTTGRLDVHLAFDVELDRLLPPPK